LLIANCDEFIFYDDLVRESQQPTDRREARTADASGRKPGDEDAAHKDDLEARRLKAIRLAVDTYDALVAERGDSGKMWASALKDAIKRRRPDFNESYFGFKAFGSLLEAAQKRGLLEVGRDEKSGTYVFRKHSNDEDEPQPASSKRDGVAASSEADGRSHPAARTAHKTAVSLPSAEEGAASAPEPTSSGSGARGQGRKTARKRSHASKSTSQASSGQDDDVKTVQESGGSRN